ncbi:lytic murein transglycosylase [Nitratireductor aquibiodomus RA22]|uniref:Lytic murein transglycosylase n=1 Tax=Nitratireductor aquibiodomus RA22 TaxID=1189611 RepID=I5BW77_9HYPH|nr:lytic murein transglycosylase [Nitratireductor aquibiodomus RA22]
MSLRNSIRLIAALCFLLVAGAASAQSIEAQFRDWLAQDLWPEAQRRGISSATFNAAFASVSPNLKLPDLVMPGESKPRSDRQHQAEFRAPSAYFQHIGGVVSGGRSRAGQLSGVLSAIEKRYGVSRGIVLAIWGRESGFGRAKIPYDAFEVLGTKAFLATRREMFREEVLSALEMVERRGVSPRAMRSSWAGAMGQPQFMPSSYLKYAVDGDGNGTADIWKSEADTLASIAHYLAQHGWVRGRDWGFEVSVPQSVSCALEGPDRGKRIADWQALGIRRVGGKAFPEHELRGEGYLMMPAGRFGPAFIVTPNFYRLKDYNESDLYALFVGHAGDRIMYGNSEFSGSWERVGGFDRGDVAAMQRRLEKLGYDVGGADGLVGFKTRRSIGEWQQKNGIAPTCFPAGDAIRRLR